jgi:hypothetical protein
LGQNIGAIYGAIFEQYSSNMWAEFGAIFEAGFWAGSGQNRSRMWAESGQDVSRKWAEFGQNRSRILGRIEAGMWAELNDIDVTIVTNIDYIIC